MIDFDMMREADMNMVTFWMENTFWLKGAEALLETDSVYLLSYIDFPACSFAFNISTKPLINPIEFIHKAKQHFKGRRSAFSLLLREHLDQGIIEECKNLKMYFVGENPGMAIDQKILNRTVPEGAQLHWVREPERVKDFSEVVAESYTDLSFPKEVTQKMYSCPERVIAPHMIMAVVYLEDRPVCSAMAMLSHGIAGIYWVGTKKEARGRGLAEFCTREVCNAAFERGAQKVILQASKFGRPIYSRMGFYEFTNYHWYISSTDT